MGIMVYSIFLRMGNAGFISTVGVTVRMVMAVMLVMASAWESKPGSLFFESCWTKNKRARPSLILWS